VNGLGGTSFSDIASVSPEPTSYFVDVTSPRIYRFVPPNEMSLLLEIPDAGKTTAIAARDTTTNDRQVYVGASGTVYGTAIIVLSEKVGGGLTTESYVDLDGVHPNAIAVDNSGRAFVASAKGIDVFQTNPSGAPSSRPQDGHAALPIEAIPTSLTFGGADYKTLFVTTNKGKIYAIPVQTAGQPR
jgi:sugar lactone lactonase YvrE